MVVYREMGSYCRHVLPLLEMERKEDFWAPSVMTVGDTNRSAGPVRRWRCGGYGPLVVPYIFSASGRVDSLMRIILSPGHEA